MTTKERIMMAVDELRKNGNKITSAAIARHLHLSEQRVHQAISRKELGLIDYKELSKKISTIETDNLTVRQIAEKIGYKYDIENLRNLLKRNKKSFKKSSGRPQKADIRRALESIKKEDVICMTSSQIARKFFGNNIGRTRQILYRYNIRFYKMRECRLSENN